MNEEEILFIMHLPLAFPSLNPGTPQGLSFQYQTETSSWGRGVEHIIYPNFPSPTG